MMTNHTLEYVQKNRQTYSASYDSMNWITHKAAEAATVLRNSLINDIFNRPGPGWRFSKTKPFAHDISLGCNLCGTGEWSCLFINGICNARCFYCPSAQPEKGQPMTSAIEFSNPEDYAAYVNAFDISGVSFSGGEPFMTFDRVLLFLKTLRARVTRPLYIWMYTNGILLTEDKLKQLKDSGLDEIRFDISANHYKLDALKKAVGMIPHVTVEIPAIPEDLEKMKCIIKELHELGVNYLNLHQLRCTPFNMHAFMERGYTFVHGPCVTILETELAALKLIRYALDQAIALPINYCSFTYRHQFQGSGAKKRAAMKIKAAYEDITPTGFIRTMKLCGEPSKIEAVHDHLLLQSVDLALWQKSKKGDFLLFSSSVWPWIDFSRTTLKVSYSEAALKSSVSYRNAFREVVLGKKKKVVVERYVRQPDFLFDQEQIQRFGCEFVLPESGLENRGLSAGLPLDLRGAVLAFERPVSGLAPYY